MFATSKADNFESFFDQVIASRAVDFVPFSSSRLNRAGTGVGRDWRKEEVRGGVEIRLLKEVDTGVRPERVAGGGRALKSDDYGFCARAFLLCRRVVQG